MIKKNTLLFALFILVLLTYENIHACEESEYSYYSDGEYNYYSDTEQGAHIKLTPQYQELKKTLERTLIELITLKHDMKSRLDLLTKENAQLKVALEKQNKQKK